MMLYTYSGKGSEALVMAVQGFGEFYVTAT